MFKLRRTYPAMIKTQIAKNKKTKSNFTKQKLQPLQFSLSHTIDEKLTMIKEYMKNKKKPVKPKSQLQRPNYTEKRSYGIACFRLHNNQYEVLLVKRRYTYAFCDFVNGRYSNKNNSSILKLFNNMTVEEKADISLLDFHILWTRVWHNSTKNYKKKYELFNNNFLKDGGERLLKLLKMSKSIDHIWELPKGQKERFESDEQCAVREFKEETGLSKDKYKLYNASRVYSYVDDNILYILKYYFATMNKTHASTKINSYTDSSVIECKWVSMVELKFLDERLYNFCSPIRNYIKKRLRIESQM